MINEKTCSPLFGSDDEDDLVERALAKLRETPGHVETAPAETFVEIHGARGSEVAYVVLAWARAIGEPDDHTVYCCRRDTAGRVRLTLLDPADYRVEGRTLTLKRSAEGEDLFDLNGAGVSVGDLASIAGVTDEAMRESLVTHGVKPGDKVPLELIRAPVQARIEARVEAARRGETFDGRGDVSGRVRSMLTGTPYGAEPRPPLDDRSAEREDVEALTDPDVGAEDEG